MMRPALFALLAAATLSACSTQRPPEGFDFRARPPAARDGDPCQRYAFETGRRRYQILQEIQGDGFAALLANRAAERAFGRCRGGRAG